MAVGSWPTGCCDLKKKKKKKPHFQNRLMFPMFIFNMMLGKTFSQPWLKTTWGYSAQTSTPPPANSVLGKSKTEK